MLIQMNKGNFTLTDSEIEVLVSGNNALQAPPARKPNHLAKLRHPLARSEGSKTFQKSAVKIPVKKSPDFGIAPKNESPHLICSCGTRMEMNFLFVGNNRRKNIATCPECQVSILVNL